MPYYLDRWVGTGVRGDEYRPSAFDDDPACTCIDLRPDPSQQAGAAFVSSPGNLSGQPGRAKLSDDKVTKSAALVNAIQNRLGLNLSSSSMDMASVAAEVLINGRTDHTRWNPLMPAGRRWEVWLGDLLWSAPVISGGAFYTDAFVRADSTNISTGAPASYTETFGDWEILSSHLHLITNADTDNDFFRVEIDVGSADMYTEMVIGVQGNYSEIYSIVRYSSSAQTFYYTPIYNDGVGNFTIRKRVANVDTRIGSSIVQLPSNGDTIRIEVQGSTVRNYRNGTLSQTVTDTSVTGNQRPGGGGYKNTGADLTFAKINSGTLGGGIAYRYGRSLAALHRR